MADEPVEEVSDGSKDFLLAEHRYFADSFWRNEEVGEKRVNFFITLVTAVLAALVALATRNDFTLETDRFRAIAAAACVALLIVGFFTLKRMIKRNRVTDEYKAALDEVRGRFHLRNYHPFGPPATRSREREPRRFGAGGLVETVAALNSVTAAALVTFLTVAEAPAVTVTAAVAAFVATLGAQALHVNRAYKRKPKT